MQRSICQDLLSARFPATRHGMTTLGRRRSGRFEAVIVTAVVLLCQATAWVHGATPHVTCLEHGESMHLTGDVPAAAAHDAERPNLAAAPAEPAAHAHEHCSLQGPRTTSVPARGETFVRAAAAVAAAPALPIAQRPVGVLSLAPKTSPPRAPAV